MPINKVTLGLNYYVVEWCKSKKKKKSVKSKNLKG